MSYVYFFHFIMYLQLQQLQKSTADPTHYFGRGVHLGMHYLEWNPILWNSLQTETSAQTEAHLI